MAAAYVAARAPLVYYTDHGCGPPLLLVHGLMVTGEMFDGVLPRLTASHHVIVPDLRGHGRSRNLPAPYTPAQLAYDLAHLLERLGISSAAVLGYSQGGAIAQQLGVDHPARCRRLVLACTYAFNMASLRERIEGHAVPWILRTLGMSRFSKLVCSVGVQGLDSQRKAWLAGLIARQDRDSMVRVWREAMAFDSRQRLRDIRCPTLVLAGSNDTAVPLQHARMLHEGIAGSQLALIEGAGHALIWTHGSDFLRAVDEFLVGSSAQDA